jgi:hypothetical protein
MNPNSPEYYVDWIREKFLKILPEDFEQNSENVLSAIKSWISIGNEHYSSYIPWIGLRTYIFLVCYVNGHDIIEDCLDIELAKKILGEKINDLKLRSDCRENLKKGLIGQLIRGLETQAVAEIFFARTFAAYTIFLDQIKTIERFKINKLVEIDIDEYFK